MSEPILDRLLAIAREEKLLEGDGASAAFSEAFRERVRRIREEARAHVEDLRRQADEQARQLEALTRHVASLEKHVATVTKHAQTVEQEAARRAEALADAEGEVVALRQEWQAASGAHERLLEHHRATVHRLLEALAPLEQAPIWRHGATRTRLAELLTILRSERT